MRGIVAMRFAVAVESDSRPSRIGDIHSSFDQILPVIAKLKLDMQVWMPFGECGKAGDDIAHAKAGRHTHPQQAMQFAAVADAMLCFVQCRENGLDPCQELAARLGGHHGPSCSCQQPGAEFGLEVGNNARGLGLR